MFDLPQTARSETMFSSMIETARQSPFTGPFTRAECAAPSNVILPGDSCAFGSTKYFLLCGVGGIISCGKFVMLWFSAQCLDIM